MFILYPTQLQFTTRNRHFFLYFTYFFQYIDAILQVFLMFLASGLAYAIFRVRILYFQLNLSLVLSWANKTQGV